MKQLHVFVARFRRALLPEQRPVISSEPIIPVVQDAVDVHAYVYVNLHVYANVFVYVYVYLYEYVRVCAHVHVYDLLQ